ncbi:TIGR04086 family membrane protein [Paraliobacillus ryukyuensis]|uniref:TIGR04086 family membrane protein n=1 Tax=Paraliobacillus ryukyuensis TaxID=200904 RepID=UPI0009A59A78|nr:TIGR04086 family membrane protein [Paraliobacillus ryukyuensis]
MKVRFTGLLYGWIAILTLMILASFILSLLLRFTSLGASTITHSTTIISLLAFLSGGTFAGIKTGEKGWLVGLLTSIGFSTFVFLYQYLGLQQPFSASQLVYHGAFLLAGMLGGIIGVNLSQKKE